MSICSDLNHQLRNLKPEVGASKIRSQGSRNVTPPSRIVRYGVLVNCADPCRRMYLIGTLLTELSMVLDGYRS